MFFPKRFDNVLVFPTSFKQDGVNGFSKILFERKFLLLKSEIRDATVCHSSKRFIAYALYLIASFYFLSDFISISYQRGKEHYKFVAPVILDSHTLLELMYTGIYSKLRLSSLRFDC